MKQGILNFRKKRFANHFDKLLCVLEKNGLVDNKDLEIITHQLKQPTDIEIITRDNLET